MAIEAYPGIAPTAGATVNVFAAGTLNLATIYADPLLTPLANPFTADERTGVYLFYAEQASYDVTIEVPDIPPIHLDTALPAIVFSGETPARTATLLVEDPDSDQQIILAQVMY